MIVDPKIVGHNVEKLRRLYDETQSQLGSVVDLYNTAVFIPRHPQATTSAGAS